MKQTAKSNWSQGGTEHQHQNTPKATHLEAADRIQQRRKEYEYRLCDDVWASVETRHSIKLSIKIIRNREWRWGVRGAELGGPMGRAAGLQTRCQSFTLQDAGRGGEVMFTCSYA
ncbi:hypothetical protein EYF80_024068 [Liparis tanakae]|uniref:Uncharacterized protein n=1 Tax=Liparis tanakae TaxID=230148 RepID=A0A4Z2HKG1_9TELE|nr:hypothetical protein EYF80_024068 [Liparis tanakae]